MSDPILLVGFDAVEAASLVARLPVECVAHEMLPRVVTAWVANGLA